MVNDYIGGKMFVAYCKTCDWRSSKTTSLDSADRMAEAHDQQKHYGVLFAESHKVLDNGSLEETK